MGFTRTYAGLILLPLLSCAHVFAAQPQSYPTRPIRVIVPSGTGGGSDVIARMIAPRLAEKLGQSVVIDNRAGAGGSIGVELAARAAPDGYTLLVVNANYIVQPLLYKVAYDAIRDFAPVSYLDAAPYVAVVARNTGAKTVRDFIGYAKANPGKLSYGSTGKGSLTHLAGELFKHAAGVNLVHVPYRGMGAVLTDILAGEIHLSFPNVIAAMPHVKSQRLVGIAVTSAERSAAAPDLPTMIEAGVPGFEVRQWHGVVGPAKLPQPIVERLMRELVSVMREPGMAARLSADGGEVVGTTPAEFAVYLQRERDKWAQVIREAGVRGE
jgi:tripartite-type tricarboxylate transporter receptor subunit TctC